MSATATSGVTRTCSECGYEGEGFEEKSTPISEPRDGGVTVVRHLGYDCPQCGAVVN